MTKVELTQDQELAIAEFVHAAETNTLIRSEVSKCLDALRKAKVLDFPEYNSLISKMNGDTVVRMQDYLLERIPQDQGKEIMKKYRTGKL